MEIWYGKTIRNADEIKEASQQLLAKPDIPLKAKEDIFRIEEVGMEWDVGGMVYEPEEPYQNL